MYIINYNSLLSLQSLHTFTINIMTIDREQIIEIYFIGHWTGVQ